MAQTHPVSVLVPQGVSETELVIKKSRFIARAAKAQSRDEAMAFVDEARKDFPDAGHHCWAYKLGASDQTVSAAMSDDGEPSGTAGKPILNVLAHKNIGDIVLVVVRYFGGIKLGAGGLVRAYSGAAQQLMDEISVVEFVQRHDFVVTLDHADEQALRHWLDTHDGIFRSVDYRQRVHCVIAVTAPNLKELRDTCDARAWLLDDA